MDSDEFQTEKTGVEAKGPAAAPDQARRRALLKELADDFRKPETAPWDSAALREGKSLAWPIR